MSIALGIGTTIVFGALATSGMGHLDLGLFRLPLDYDYIIYPAATTSILGLVIGSLLTHPSPESTWKQFISTDES